MSSQLTWWWRAVRCLRHPELTRELGRLREERAQWERISLSYPASRVHREVVFHGWERERLRLAPGVTIERGTVLAWGEDATGSGSIEVGEDTWIGEYNNLRLTGPTRISIGRKCLISQFCSLLAANHSTRLGEFIQDQGHNASATGVAVGDDVWIGAGASIMPSVTIGHGAVIAAGSVVTRSVPANEIWGGIPARKLKERDAPLMDLG